MTSSEEQKGKPSPESGGKKGKYRDRSHQDWRDLVPHCIYFYFYTKRQDFGYDVEYYFYDNGDHAPIPEGSLQQRIRKLVENALGPKDDPRPRGNAFPGEDWKRISWLVVAMKGDTFDNDEAVEIKWQNGSSRQDNHSFFDGEESSIRVGSEDISVMWAWNHMRDADGNPLHGSEDFSFSFNPLRRDRPEEPDENGTNTGPSFPPPPRSIVPPPPHRGDAEGESGAGA